MRDAGYVALFVSFAWLAWQAALAHLGAIAALLVPLLFDWAANPIELAPAHHGWMSWALTALALVILVNLFRKQ